MHNNSNHSKNTKILSLLISAVFLISSFVPSVALTNDLADNNSNSGITSLSAKKTSQSAEKYDSDASSPLNAKFSSAVTTNTESKSDTPKSGSSDYVSGEILYEKKNSSSGSYSLMSDFESEYGLSNVKKIDTSAIEAAKKKSPNYSLCSDESYTVYKAKISGDVKKTCEKLNKRSDIKYAQPNYIYKLDSIAIPGEVNNSGYYSYYMKGYMDSLGIVNTWTANQTLGSGVTVAVIDTGIYISSSSNCEFKGQLWNDGSGHNGWNAVSNNYDLTDTNGHGTNVAGIIAMASNNYGGVGIAPEAKVMVLKSDSSQGLLDSDIIKCINYAVNNKAQIINMSFTSNEEDPLLTEKIQSSSNVALFVAAAGNDGKDTSASISYPAADQGVIGVMSYGENELDSSGNFTGRGIYGSSERLSSFSNYDTSKQYYEVAAPGAGLLGPALANANDYEYYGYSGTSQATPVVCAVAALYMSKYPSATPQQTYNAIINGSTGTILGYASSGGAGTSFKKLTPSGVLSYGIPATSIKLNTSSLTLDNGSQANLTATVLPSNTTSTVTSWSSSDTNVATVTNGTVTAKAGGTTRITVTTNNGLSAYCDLTVATHATGVTISSSNVVAAKDSVMKLTAVLTPSNTTDKVSSWSSSNTDVATVDTSGNVTAKAIGTATITVTTTNGLTASCTFTVTDKTALKTAIGSVPSDGSIYTDATWSTVTAELSNANKVNDNQTATQAQIDDACLYLRTAVNGLIEKSIAVKANFGLKIENKCLICSTVSSGTSVATLLSELSVNGEGSSDNVSKIKIYKNDSEVLPATDNSIAYTGMVVKLYINNSSTPFETLTIVLKGDLNCDGIVDKNDLNKIFSYSRNETALTALQQNASDINDDGVSDIADVLFLDWRVNGVSIPY